MNKFLALTLDLDSPRAARNVTAFMACIGADESGDREALHRLAQLSADDFVDVLSVVHVALRQSWKRLDRVERDAIGATLQSFLDDLPLDEGK